MTTRAEKTGIRDLIFSGWIREKLPDSSNGFCVSDLDFILWNWKEKKLMLLEIKSKNADVPKFQRYMWSNIHKWIQRGIRAPWEYKGFHLIKFENTCFDDGICYLDNKEVSEEELIEFLSF